MWILGLVIVIGVALYFGFQAVDNVALPTHTSIVNVLGKDYRGPNRSHYIEIVNRQAVAMPRVSPEAYLLRIALDGRELECPVPLPLFESTKEGDAVTVTYQRRRITGAVRVLRVTR
jgi:hypothetical protein